MTCPNKRSAYDRYKYYLIFFGIIAILNYWYLIFRYWWVILIVGVIVKLMMDDAKKKDKPQKRTVKDPSIRVLKPVNVVEKISMIVAAYRICFTCGQGFPLTDQFQHQRCPNCGEIHNLSNNLKLMHYQMIEPILINCHKCNLPGNYQDQFCSDCGTPVDHELRLIHALELKKVSHKYKWMNSHQ